VAPPAEDFEVADQVTHDKYGLGRVVSVKEDNALIIDFGSRLVRIMMPCAKLSKL
jgi:predicted RNA-binding protein (virulence factor B family)